MNAKKITALLLSLLMLFTVLAGCGSAAAEEPETADAAATTEETPESEITEEDLNSVARAQALAAVEELRALQSDSEKLEARFDEIMAADTKDPGLASFPEGYTFTTGTMMTEFEEASRALGEYEVSDPVKTSAGYHVILRLPLDIEGYTMEQDANTGYYMTLRKLVANELFNADLLSQIGDAEVVWAGDFEDLNLNELFGITPDAESSEEKVAAAEEASGEEAAEEPTVDVSAALETARTAYPADITVVTINGIDLPWNVYFSELAEDLQQYINSFGTLPSDFDDELMQGESYGDYFKAIGLSYCVYYCIGQSMFEEKGLSLTDEQQAELDGYWDEMVAAYGGEEELLALLNSYCMDKESYQFLLASSEKMNCVFNATNGESGELLSEEEILSWAEENNYIRTKHILYQEPEEEPAETEAPAAE